MDLNTLGELKDRLNLSGMGKPALVGVVAVILVVAVVAGMRFASTATAYDFEVSRTADQEDPVQGEDAEPASLFVHVAGSVVNPGLYELKPGARVADAVNAAGGFSDDASIGSVNLARTLVDGEQVSVVSQSQQPDLPQGDVGSTAATSASSTGVVNINTANAVELTSLPGIGEATAAKIVADRQANGPYKSIEDLKRVAGVGDKKFEALSSLICI